MPAPVTIPSIPVTWTRANIPADAYAEFGSASQPVGLGSARMLAKHVLPSSINVLAFGAVGDGTTDDAPAFKLAIEYANTNGIAQVVVPNTGNPYILGTFYDNSSGSMAIVTKTGPQPAFSQTNIGLYSGMSLIGLGMPTLKVKDNSYVLSGAGRRGSLIVANVNATVGNSYIEVRNFILDGNAAGQGVTPTSSEHWRTDHCMFIRCFSCMGFNLQAINGLGDHLGSEEAFGFRADLSVNVQYVRCRSLGNGGSGFAVNHSYQTQFVGCISNENLWNGFTDNASQLTRNGGVNTDIGGPDGNAEVWYDGGLWSGTTATDGPLKNNSKTILSACHAARNGYGTNGVGINFENASGEICGGSVRQNLGFGVAGTSSLRLAISSLNIENQFNGIITNGIAEMIVNGCVVKDVDTLVSVAGNNAPTTLIIVNNNLTAVNNVATGAYLATTANLVIDNNSINVGNTMQRLVRIATKTILNESYGPGSTTKTTDIGSAADQAMWVFNALGGSPTFRMGQTGQANDYSWFLQSYVGGGYKTLMHMQNGTTDISFRWTLILGNSGTGYVRCGAGLGDPATNGFAPPIWPQGSTWSRSDGGVGTNFYVLSAAGWVAVA